MTCFVCPGSGPCGLRRSLLSVPKPNHSPWQHPLHVPNSQLPPRSPTFPYAETEGNREQQSHATGPSPERLNRTPSPADKQGWASVTRGDESKRWGRAGLLSFWPAPASRVPAGRGQPLAQPQLSAQRDQPGRAPRQSLSRTSCPAARREPGEPRRPPRPPPDPGRSTGNLAERREV